MNIKTQINPIRYIYSIYGLMLLVAFLIALFPFALLVLFLRKPLGGNLFYKVASEYARCWLFFMRIHYKELYIEHSVFNKKEAAIYIANHQSYIDIILMLSVMNTPFRPLGKDQMSKIPVFGFFYDRLVITVNRESSTSKIQSLLSLSKTLEAGMSVFIFPEGTFNETTSPLKIFRTGAFQLAIKKRVTIRPLLFLDSKDRMHYSSLLSMRPGPCRVAFLKEIHSNCQQKTEQLKDKVFETMKQALLEFRPLGY